MGKRPDGTSWALSILVIGKECNLLDLSLLLDRYLFYVCLRHNTVVSNCWAVLAVKVSSCLQWDSHVVENSPLTSSLKHIFVVRPLYLKCMHLKFKLPMTSYFCHSIHSNSWILILNYSPHNGSTVLSTKNWTNNWIELSSNNDLLWEHYKMRPA